MSKLFEAVYREAKSSSDKIRCSICGKRFSKDEGRYVGGTHDFQCNACQRFMRQTHGKLEEAMWALKPEYKDEALDRIQALKDWLYGKFGDDALFDILDNAKDLVKKLAEMDPPDRPAYANDYARSKGESENWDSMEEWRHLRTEWDKKKTTME